MRASMWRGYQMHAPRATSHGDRRPRGESPRCGILPRVRRTIVTGTLALCAACAAPPLQRPVPATVVPLLVLPLVVETESGVSAASIEDALTRGFVAEESALSPSVGESPDEECIGRASCLRGLGRDVGAEYVVVAQLASLGDTAVLRVRLVAVGDDEGEVIRQVVVTPANEPALVGAAETLAYDLADPFRPEPLPEDPRRRRVRIAVPIAVVGAAAVGLGVGLRDRPPAPDIVVDPP